MARDCTNLIENAITNADIDITDYVSRQAALVKESLQMILDLIQQEKDNSRDNQPLR